MMRDGRGSRWAKRLDLDSLLDSLPPPGSEGTPSGLHGASEPVAKPSEERIETGIRSCEPCFPRSTLAAVLEAAERLRLATEAERAAAPEAAERLERNPESRARLLIQNQAHFQTWGLVEELTARSFQAIFDSETSRGVRLARLAVSVADQLDEGTYGASLAADLKARTWGSLGNAYRCAGQFRAAAAALRQADDLLLEGTGDPLEEANLLSYRASLATVLGDHVWSLEILGQAAAIYRELDETVLLGKILVQQSAALPFLDPERGVVVAREAEELVAGAENRRLLVSARLNHIGCLTAAGKPDQAQMLLDASRSLFRDLDDPWSSLLVAWAEARLAFAQGRLEEAEAAFEHLLGEHLRRNQRLEGVLAALDLAAVRLGRGKAREASELAAAMAQHLRDWGAHARAREAWALLRHALSLERANVELIREVADYLRRAWRNPRERFRSEAQAADPRRRD